MLRGETCSGSVVAVTCELALQKPNTPPSGARVLPSRSGSEAANLQLRHLQPVPNPLCIPPAESRTAFTPESAPHRGPLRLLHTSPNYSASCPIESFMTYSLPCCPSALPPQQRAQTPSASPQATPARPECPSMTLLLPRLERLRGTRHSRSSSHKTPTLPTDVLIYFHDISLRRWPRYPSWPCLSTLLYPR